MSGVVPLESSEADGGTLCPEAVHVSSSSPFQAGDSVYCRLSLRGVVRIARAMVVKSEPTRTVFACPAALGIASSGDWAGSVDECHGTTFECACIVSGKSCMVVFYDVTTAALSSIAPPGGSDFETVDGELVLPEIDSLVDIFHGQAGGDFLTMQADRWDGPESNQLYHEVLLGDKHKTFVWNSLVLVPGFLSKDDCYTLIDAADRSAQSGSRASNVYSIQAGMNRFPVRMLDLEAQMLSTAICARLLRTLEEHFPELCVSVFGRWPLTGMKFSFWPGEPAINRYMVSGGLNPHIDQRMFTINILLSNLGSFSGGGTTFWPQEQPGPTEHSDMDRKDEVLVQALQGTAIFFNGSVTHAARYVQSGIRHIFSASFNLYSLDEE